MSTTKYLSGLLRRRIGNDAYTLWCLLWLAQQKKEFSDVESTGRGAGLATWQIIYSLGRLRDHGILDSRGYVRDPHQEVKSDRH